MNRVLSSCVLASVFATGCVADEGDESYVILANLVPEIDTTTMLTTFTPSIDGPFLSQASLNAGDGRPVVVGSMVESRIVAPEGKESLRTIFIDGANITARVSAVTQIVGTNVQIIGADEVFEYKLSFSALVRPNGGFNAAVYTLLPLEIVATIGAKLGLPPDGGSAFVNVDTTTTLFGEYYGERVDSTSFNFPVTVFAGTTPAEPQP